MECSAGAAIEQRGRELLDFWGGFGFRGQELSRTSGMTPVVIGLWRQGGAEAGMPVVEIWRRWASSCGRFDGRNQVNGARIEGAQVRRQAAAGARASAEQQIVGRLLTGRGKELSRPWSGLAKEESSGSEDQAARLCRSDRKDGRHRALRPGSGDVMMGAGGEVLKKGCRGASGAIGEGDTRIHSVAG